MWGHTISIQDTNEEIKGYQREFIVKEGKVWLFLRFSVVTIQTKTKGRVLKFSVKEINAADMLAVKIKLWVIEEQKMCVHIIGGDRKRYFRKVN